MDQEKADTLRDAADILDELSRDPSYSPPRMTHLAVIAADLRRVAERAEENPQPPGKPHYVSLGVTDDEAARGDDYGRYDFPNLRRER
jgi:hypothetical protein